ncbi:TrkH family potassium uptake protein [Peptoniphilus sp. KCTC 25270]|uniref:TrkH family potassium uptake protein n=1 Tax=Peptoniphilus sp. KCTC 25270 TaxID=2897414 RepID=UPI001E4D783A|nr:TrkH family potassium uptake protein [Peptoniphilus sp. KCTC 25270]MCD1147971.1 TrkH family potassium uptake protein [Peptoniphilus sp. KCTC 25270]
MNYVAAFKVIGSILMIEGVFMLPPFLYALIYKETTVSGFLIAIILCFFINLVIKRMHQESVHIRPKDGLFIVVIGWIFVSILGAIPYVISGAVPTFMDALFETVSGFTTTGSTVIKNIEAIDKSLILWRSMTHWIGGMGILVFTLAILPKVGNDGMKIFKAEIPGPVTGKVEPRLKDTAKYLYKVYILLTIAVFVLLVLAKMPVFDALIHTLGVTATGGFSSHTDSVARYGSQPMILLIMSIFMIVCGTNFALYYSLHQGKLRDVLKDEELHVYYGIIIIATILIALNLSLSHGQTAENSLVDSFFHVTSVISTAGFATADYDLWPSFSKFIILLLTFVGSCAGSTAGGMKVIRILILGKIIRREILRVTHPNAVMPITLNGKRLDESIIMGIVGYMALYFLLLIVSVGIVTLNNIDFVSSLSATISCLSNVGPGFNLVGPSQTFADFSTPIKLLFTGLMLLGRLEFFTIIALITPKSWVHHSEI